MKIGLSYSRCVRDIVDGVVDIRDVLVLITRTDFDPHNDEDWNSIWVGYHNSYREWRNYPPEAEAKFYRSQADALAKQAAAMRRKAEELVPTVKKTAKDTA